MTTEMVAAPQSALDVTAHLPVLLVGLRWLFDTEQPEGAVQCPAGDCLPSVGGRGFRFIPLGRDGHAALGIAVTTGVTGDAIGGHELAAFIDLLEGMGEEVLAIDAVAGSTFCTLTLNRTAHPTLLDAVARYRAGYLAHVSASPFGPEQRPDVATLSAAELQRQLHEAQPDEDDKQLTVAAGGVHWLDRIGRDAMRAPTAALSRAQHLVSQS
jgi:hypothetical protein